MVYSRHQQQSVPTRSLAGRTQNRTDAPGARQVSELLILREDVPRSLRSCLEEINEILVDLPGNNGRPAQRLVAELDARLRYTVIDEILAEGLHVWLSDSIDSVRLLANAIQSSYLETV